MAGSDAPRAAGALARWIVRRRALVAALWAAAAIVLLPLAGGVERRLQVAARVDGSESARVEGMLVHRFGSPFARYAVLVLEGVPSPATPEGAAVLRRATASAARVPGVTRTFSYLDAPDTLFTGSSNAPAGAATYVIVGLDAARGPADALVPPLRAATAPLADSLRARYPAAALDWTGEAALNFDLRRASAADAARAERRVLPLTLALLLVAFGAVVAALLPVSAGALAIALALGAAAVVTRFFPLSILLQNVVSMLGLGLGIDYALLLVSRFRESLARGLAPDDAAAEAAHHAGHGILLSGLAVAVGFAALLAVPLSEMRSVAVGGLLVVVVSMLLATTLLPGLLAWLGARVDLGRLRRRARPAGVRRDDGGARWRRWGRWVSAHPWRVLVATGLPLAALVAQARRLETGLPRGDWLPPALESARGVHALAAAGRSGVVQTVRVVVELPRDVSALDGDGWRGIARLDSALAADPRIARTRSLPGLLRGNAALVPYVPGDVRGSFVGRDERVALVEAVPREGVEPGELTTLVRSLREADAARLTGVAGARLAVGGLPAFDADYESAIAACTPRVVGLVVGGTFVVLLIGFRSVLVPLKAIALNLVSVGAAFGAVTLVFQDGHGARLVGLAAPLDGTFPAVPLLVFCIVFGLSMDYEVFLVARVAEARRGGAGESEALAEGMARTGPVITSAAAIMIVVFAAFTLGDFVLMKILGFALAVAVLLDATIVRAALGPALLALAGRWNWWPGDSVAESSQERRRRESARTRPLGKSDCAADLRG
ncbi:MAG TPA: MMPL family transporter [Gemmatimonadaceae bacterium]|nr:MMPL family transporter [Gemmatimonadaceae bacterium]